MKKVASITRSTTGLRRSRGVAIVYVVVVLSALIGIVGLAADTGYVYMVAAQLQNAADSAALAGAAQVQSSSANAITAAVNCAALNKAGHATVQLSSAQGDVLCGYYNQTASTFTANATPYNAVKVTARRTSGSPAGPLNLIFGPMFGVGSSNVSRSSIAVAGGAFNAGLIVLDPTSSGSFTVTGTPTLNCGSGGIQVNSSHPSACSCQSKCTVSASELRVCGGISSGGGCTLPSKCYSNTTACADPCSSLPAPTKGTALVASGTSCSPGYYPGGITVAANKSCTLSPGTYCLGPPGISCASGCTLNATGCTIYLTTGTNPNNGYGALNISSCKSCTITAPTTGTCSGCSVFVDRSCPTANSISLAGNSSCSLGGCVYAPTCGLALSGTSTFTCANQCICHHCTVSGSSTINIAYDNRNPVTINNVFLCK